jgi:hypothetical protein
MNHATQPLGIAQLRTGPNYVVLSDARGGDGGVRQELEAGDLSPSARSESGPGAAFSIVASGAARSQALEFCSSRPGACLLYATGGVAFSEISGSFAYARNLSECPGAAASAAACASALGSLSPSATTATATTAFTWSDTRTGYTVGAGWETELFPGWKARLEYRYTDFGTYTKTFGLNTSCTGSSAPASSCTASPSSSVSINLDESFHTVRVGLAFDLFGGKAPY